jgi:serine/threonine-protein kinase
MNMSASKAKHLENKAPLLHATPAQQHPRSAAPSHSKPAVGQPANSRTAGPQSPAVSPFFEMDEELESSPCGRSVIQTGIRLVGQTIDGKYRIEEFIGAGAFAAVYRATELESRRQVAFKVLHATNQTDPAIFRHFQLEARAASQIYSHCVASVLDSGLLEDGRPFMAMEFVSGKTLRRHILERGRLTAQEACAVIAAAARGLAAAHMKRILHRDVKPANIMITDDRRSVKLLDFGLARLTDEQPDPLSRAGHTVGTPAYMSPEQCCGKRLDARSDIYALGCVLYECLTGQRPFDAISYMEYMRQHVEETPPPLPPELAIPPAVQHVLLRAMAKNPEERPLTALRFAEELEAAACGQKPRRSVRASLKSVLSRLFRR